MRLTVLGCYGPYPAAGEACSGYLLEGGGAAVLLDCGNGVLSRLQYYLEPGNLNAVVLSHLHGDHISDLYVLRYALQLKQQADGKPLKVYCPAEPASEFNRLPYKNYLEARAVSTESVLTIGGMKISFYSGVHAYQSHLIKVEEAGKTFVYSGDTEYFPELESFISGADLFLCEANYLRQDVELGRPNHMAAYQAAQAAVNARVRRLVLTHHHPQRGAKVAVKEAGEIFKEAEAAAAGDCYLL